jgi:DNA polymerase-3 subunit epsilon
MISDFQTPIVFFDLETTGLDLRKDRILQYSFLKINKGVQTMLASKVNPGIPISPESSEVHGFYEEDLKDAKLFSEGHAESIYEYIQGCALSGFNIKRFDIPILSEDFSLAGIDWDWRDHEILDVKQLYAKLHPRTLAATYRNYFNKDFHGAHDASADTYATFDIFSAMVGNRELEQETVEEIASFASDGKDVIDLDHKFTHDEKGNVVFNFSKNKGQHVNGNKGMLNWMLMNDFSSDTKKVIEKILADPTAFSKNQ